MSSSNSKALSILDKVRLDNGTEEYRKYFRNLVRQNKGKALQLINDKNLSFSSLFMLRSDLQKYNLFPYLSTRNRNTLKISDTVLSRNSDTSSRSTSDYKQMNYDELLWMFETGNKDDGISDEYDEVLDTAAILLIREHKNKTILNDVLEIILNRHKKGYYINDLVWALFESRDPQCLVLIANRLQSTDPSEIELTQKLLSFIPYIQMNRFADNSSQYTYAVNWIQENYPFLYYTSEGFQQSNAPIPYAVSLEGKYLFKPVSVETGEIHGSLTDYEKQLLDKFRELDIKSKLLLSNYSFLLHQQNVYGWSTWLNYPVTEQVRIAETMIGGLPW